MLTSMKRMFAHTSKNSLRASSNNEDASSSRSVSNRKARSVDTRRQAAAPVAVRRTQKTSSKSGKNTTSTDSGPSITSPSRSRSSSTTTSYHSGVSTATAGAAAHPQVPTPTTITTTTTTPKKPLYTTTLLDGSVHIPESAITYDMVTKVIESWENGIKRVPGWERIFGEKFTRKIFQLEPETISMFGFGNHYASDDAAAAAAGAGTLGSTTTRPGIQWDDPGLSQDEAFMQKSVRLIKAIDMAVACLGPDISPLEEQLFDLGVRHTAMNCRPYHWPIVGQALVHVLDEHHHQQQQQQQQQAATADITADVREAWIVIYNFLAYHMIRGLLHDKPSLAGRAPLQEAEHVRSKLLTTPAPVKKKRMPTST